MRPREPSPAAAAAEARRHRTTVAVVLALSAATLARGALGASPPVDTLVEVMGEVPRPGVHAASDVGAAVAAAGGPALVDARPLVDGDRVDVRVGRAEVRPSPRAGLFGRPVDIDRADVDALLGLPGIGPHTAAAIVAYREQNGPFGDVRALSVVPGIGPATLDRLAANAVATGTPRAPVPAGPLDPNTASAAALEAWPGVGPALAARIVEARPFERCEALDRVKGIGPAVLAKIAPVCAVAP